MERKHFPTFPPPMATDSICDGEMFALSVSAISQGDGTRMCSGEGPVRLKSCIRAFSFSWLLFGLACLLSSHTILVCKMSFSNVLVRKIPLESSRYFPKGLFFFQFSNRRERKRGEEMGKLRLEGVK